MGALAVPKHGVAGALGDINCYTSCWRLESTYGLWAPAPKRRGSFDIAEADGDLTTESLRGPRAVDLQFYVIGEVDPTGDPYADAFAGADANVELLVAGIADSAEDEFGTIAVSITRGSRTKVGRFAVDDFTVEPGPAKESDRWVFVKGQLPAGQLELVP